VPFGPWFQQPAGGEISKGGGKGTYQRTREKERNEEMVKKKMEEANLMQIVMGTKKGS
jgi:hypothetical protein